MILTLAKLREEAHLRTNSLRRITMILESEAFSETWNILTDDKKLLVQNCVVWADKAKLVKTLKTIMNQELGTMGIRALRALAKKRGLSRYMQMSKATLLSELTRLEEIYENQD